MNPLISVVVPVYNVSNYLKQCLDSIINQTYTNLEIILVNDGSTDDSLKICEDYARIDSRITVVSQVNTGLSGARNTGIEKAIGTYLMFVDSDDWIELECVQRLYDNSFNHDLVCCSYNRIFINNSIPRKLNVDGAYAAATIQRRIVGLIGDELNDPSQADSLVTAWVKLYKTEIIKQNKIYFIDTKSIGTEDAIFNIYYLEYSVTAFVIDKPFINYRKYNTQSLTSTYKKSLFAMWKNLYSLIFDVVKDKDALFLKAYQNRICLSVIGLGMNELSNKDGFWSRYKNMKLILNAALYQNAYKKLELRFFPMHWKLFFFFAKYKMVFPLMVLLFAIKKIIKK